MSSVPSRAAKAAVRPLNLAPVVIGSAAAGGLAAAGLLPVAAAMGALSIATWGAMVAFDVLSASAAPAHGPPAAPDRREIGALQLRQLLIDVDTAAGRVIARIDAHDGVLAAALAEVRADALALVEQAADLARRGDAIHRYLADVDPAEIAREVQQRLEAARRATDGEAARAFRTAAEANRRQLEHRAELGALYERITAELVAVDATLEELEVRVVRVTLQDPANALQEGALAGEQMKQVRERIGILEESARRTLQEVG